MLVRTSHHFKAKRSKRGVVGATLHKSAKAFTSFSTLCGPSLPVFASCLPYCRDSYTQYFIMTETQNETCQPVKEVAGNIPVQAEAAAKPKPMSSRRGYYELADRMALAENELAIFRNFKNLDILSLLHLQAEILILESDLESIRNKDDNQDEAIEIPYASGEGDLAIESATYKRRLFSSCIVMMQRVARNDPNQCKQYMKMVELRTKLREYS